MIGKMTTGTSFYHCISYCLEDKKNLSEEQKIQLSQKDNLQHKDRAEVLFYNKCFGNARELASQFKEVRKLSSRVEKPVLHISLTLAPGEKLSKDQFTDIGRACAEEFKIDQNQYICILHKDKREQHIHIVANRVGYDGRAISLSNNYLRMANLCRKLELKHNLQQVLSPRIFLPKEQRLIPRQDARKEKLRNDIRQTLKGSLSYSDFEQKMKALGYQVLKGRGISFIDDKKVKIKGSEVDFSLMKIEKILTLNQQIKEQKLVLKTNDDLLPKQRQEKDNNSLLPRKIPKIRQARDKGFGNSLLNDLEKERNNLLYDVMKPEGQGDSINPELLKESRRHKKRLKPRI
ncbi:MAG: relaxase/mobilization nuclease domain-containing protein [Bacteroidia bacterium]|nr:relaxase/mobilization nuclease domain-containing protein [Bacteroidia bacterium]